MRYERVDINSDSSNLLPESLDNLIQCAIINAASAALALNIMLRLLVHHTTLSTRPASQDRLHNNAWWCLESFHAYQEVGDPLGEERALELMAKLRAAQGKMDGALEAGRACDKILQGRNGSATSDTMRQAGEERLAVVCGCSMTCGAKRWASTTET